MLLTKQVYRTSFLTALKANGLTVYVSKNNFYILIKGNDSQRIVAVEFVTSFRVNPKIQGSLNGNVLNGIGQFKFTIPKWEEKISHYIFAFLNYRDHEIEYVIVPDEVLRARLKNREHFPEKGKKAELVLWLMEDHCVFDVTHISGGEGEWFMLSKGVNGRMADGTDLDYTKHLDNWNILIDKLKR